MAFESFGIISEAITGTAPTLFSASTADSLAVISAPGYLNYLAKEIKANDIIFINYADVSTYPLNTGEAAIYVELKVQYDPVLNNYNLIAPNGGANQSAISSLGVHSAAFTNAGGSATVVITDARINPSSIVLAAWASSANVSLIQKVTPGQGILTVLTSADPGASVLDYISYTPSVLLQNSGVHATSVSNAGASATLTINDPLIVVGDVVNANFVSSVTAVEVQKVTVAAGVLTVLCSAAPGVCVLAYSSVAPSVALTTAGLYAANAANAGGSATTAITDAKITATSVVTANWATSANAVNIEKVTPSASTLTILSSGDPGASSLAYIATPVAE